MFRTARFIAEAVRCRCAYIDMDGCILRPFPVPAHIPRSQRLEWWRTNLDTTPIIRRRLPLLYLLRALGVNLYVWTNRAPRHCGVTLASLGVHARLFHPRRQWFMGGAKGDLVRFGPCMDDDTRYIVGPGDLLVRGTRDTLIPETTR